MSVWVLSANPSMYDHQKAFDEQGYIDWKQTRNFKVGDIVFIYVTKPLSRIRYKTIVTSVDKSPYIDSYWLKDISNDQLGKRYMRLKYLSKCDSDELSLEVLKLHGLYYPPQSPGKAKPELVSYLAKEKH